MPATIVAAVLVALPVAVTGGIHLDGLCDTSDALASWAPRERKLEIMHDPQAGAFGVIGVVVYLILQFSLFTALPLTAGAFLALLCSLVFSRALSGLAVECWPAARADGMAVGLSPAKKRAGDRRAALRFRCGFGCRDGRVRSGRRRPYGGGGAFGARVVPPCCPVPLRRGDG